MARSWESFCEHICFLIRGRDVVKLDYASLDKLSYQVVPDVDVLVLLCIAGLLARWIDPWLSPCRLVCG